MKKLTGYALINLVIITGLAFVSPAGAQPVAKYVSTAAKASVFLDELAQDTWAYLSSDWASDNHLPWSWRSFLDGGGSYANPAEIGFYALSWMIAYDMQRSWSPSWEITEIEVNAILDRLRGWQTGSQVVQPNGPNAFKASVFYQWYWVANDPPVVGAGPGDHVVPSVDNAWLAASLITIREYAAAHGHSLLAQKAASILNDLNFRLWYHSDAQRFSWGANEDPYEGALADYYSNENRIINFIARALGQMSTDEFQRSLAALEQPGGSYESILVDRINWDGSYFTYASPGLFIKESQTAYGDKSLLPATQAQITYAQTQGYSAWGLSDCFDLGLGGYIYQGAPPAASLDALESHPGVITPHASALALTSGLSSHAEANLSSMQMNFPGLYDASYGFYDAVMADPVSSDYGITSNRFSALDQEWIFLALANAQRGFIWEYFYRAPGVRQAHLEMYPAFQAWLPLIQNNFTTSLTP